jgi:hypothetical protein
MTSPGSCPLYICSNAIPRKQFAMNDIDRRRFLGATAGAAAALGAGSVLRAEEATSKSPTATKPSAPATVDGPPAPPIVELGKTGVKMSRLGQGTGVHGVGSNSHGF